MPNILFFIVFSTDFPPFPSPTQPSVLLGEDPPPYSPLTSPESGSAPVISCRVCQSLISVEGKIHQHVVKCGVCNEATVRSRTTPYSHTLSSRVVNVCEKCKLGVCTCVVVLRSFPELFLQLSARLTVSHPRTQQRLFGTDAFNTHCLHQQGVLQHPGHPPSSALAVVMEIYTYSD